MPGIYALAPGGWNDQQITKNCGLLPWLFHKKYGWEAVMVGVRTAETYPSLRYVPGLRMDFLADDRVATADAYLDAHAADIDAWEDIIDSGRCGMHFPVGDVEAFAEVLAEICGDSGQLASFGRHAAAYAAQAYDFTKIAAQLYVLLCGRRPGV